MFKKEGSPQEDNNVPAIQLSRFSTRGGRNCKVCRLCSNRVTKGVIVWRGGLIRSFICYDCLRLAYRFSVGKK